MPNCFYPDARFVCNVYADLGIDDCWLGMPRRRTASNVDLGCDFGCRSCDELVFTAYGFWQNVVGLGRRFLRPHPIAASRDARGAFTDLQSVAREGNQRPLMKAHRVPLAINYERATCWDNSGLECFKYDSCRCYPGVAQTSGGAECDDGTAPGEPVTGLLPDEFFYIGHEWKHGDAQIWCRHFRDKKPAQVFLGSDTMLSMPIFARTSPCVANPLVFCVGLVADSVCPSSFGGQEPNRIGFPFVSNQSYQAWNHLALEKFGGIFLLAKPAEDDHVPDAYMRAVTLLKETALRRIFEDHIWFPDPATGAGNFLRFDQIDKETGSNDNLDRWSRRWALHDMPGGITRLPVLFGLPNCYLRRTGCPVFVTVRAAKAAAVLGLALYGVDVRETEMDDPEVRIYPYARLLLECDLAVTAHLVIRCKTTAIRVHNDDPNATSATLIYAQASLLTLATFNAAGEQIHTETITLINKNVGDVVFAINNLAAFGWHAIAHVPNEVPAFELDVFGTDHVYGAANALDWQMPIRLVNAGDPDHSSWEYTSPPEVQYGLDEIVYVFDDTTIDIPSRATWRAGVWETVQPRPNRLFFPPGPIAGPNMCCKLQGALDGLQLTAWPYSVDSMPDRPWTTYAGTMKLRTQLQTWFQNCGGAV